MIGNNFWLLFGFAALALMETYRMVAAWLTSGDLAAIYDVVPGLIRVLTLALGLGLALNLLILILNLWKNRGKSV